MTGPRLRGLPPALAAACALLAAGPAAAATLEVTLEPRTATVGDRVEAVLVLATGPGELAGEPRFPVWGERWGAAEIVEAGPVERGRSGDGSEHRQRLVLVAFRPGALELPPKGVAVPGPDGTAELWTPAGLTLQVDSVLPAGASSESAAGELEPRPPAPPRALPLGAAFWWSLAGLSLLAAAVALGIRRRRRASESAVPARRLAPREELEAALRAALERDAEEGHVVLSLALRRYLGRAFAFPAAESTTSEVRRTLRGLRAPAAVEARTDELLRACDRVKFAREPVPRSTLEARVEAAREIAGEVGAHLAPPSPLPSDGAAPDRSREAAA